MLLLSLLKALRLYPPSIGLFIVNLVVCAAGPVKLLVVRFMYPVAFGLKCRFCVSFVGLTPVGTPVTPPIEELFPMLFLKVDPLLFFL